MHNNITYKRLYRNIYKSMVKINKKNTYLIYLKKKKNKIKVNKQNKKTKKIKNL